MNDTIRTEIHRHMALAFFASAWADWADEFGPGTPGMGADVMDVMPDEIDPAALQAATDLIESLEKQHSMSIAEIFEKAVEISGDDGDRPKTAEMFGHYAAMGAMGHGVSLHDAMGKAAAKFVKVPYMEFSSFDLDGNTYPIPVPEDTRTPEQKARDAEILAILGLN